MCSTESIFSQFDRNCLSPKRPVLGYFCWRVLNAWARQIVSGGALVQEAAFLIAPQKRNFLAKLPHRTAVLVHIQYLAYGLMVCLLVFGLISLGLTVGWLQPSVITICIVLPRKYNSNSFVLFNLVKLLFGIFFFISYLLFWWYSFGASVWQTSFVWMGVCFSDGTVTTCTSQMLF